MCVPYSQIKLNVGQPGIKQPIFKNENPNDLRIIHTERKQDDNTITEMSSRRLNDLANQNLPEPSFQRLLNPIKIAKQISGQNQKRYGFQARNPNSDSHSVLHSNNQEVLSTNSAQLISNLPNAVVLIQPNHILRPVKHNSRMHKKFTSYAYHNVQDPISSSSLPSQNSLPTLQDCTSSKIRYKRDLEQASSGKQGSLNSNDKLRYNNKYNKSI